MEGKEKNENSGRGEAFMGIEDVSMLFTFIGGLGMFLYGMHIMAEGLQHFAGGRM